MAEIKKAELDRMIRAEGEKSFDTSDFELVGGSYYKKTSIEGRYVEVKFVAKSVDFDEDSLNALKTEREIVESRKAENARKAESKKLADLAKREAAKAKVKKA